MSAVRLALGYAMLALVTLAALWCVYWIGQTMGWAVIAVLVLLAGLALIGQ